MKQFYYYKSLRKTIIQFLDLFNDINVARYEEDGSTVIKYVKVPLKFAGKEKIWHWWYDRKDDAMLPIMSATLVSVDYAMDRQVSRLTNLVKSVSPSAGGLEQFLNPIPYNLGFTLNIWSLYMSDADQILEQILPYFSPNVTIRINIPEVGGSFDVKVIFQSCTPDVTQEIGDDENRMILWNLDFLVHTYLFQPVKDPGLIKEIIMKLYATEESWAERGTYTDGTTETTFTSGASGHEAESMYIKATQIDGSWYDDAGDPYSEYQIFGND